MGSGFGDAERVVTRWMRFRCKDDNLPGEMKRPHAAPYMFRPAGLLLVFFRKAHGTNFRFALSFIFVQLRITPY